MLRTLIELVVAPGLAALATLAARRWGPRAGGVVSAFPAIVGPVLLITALERGRAFTAHTANGTLLGLVALSGFALAYGSVASRRGWVPSLAAGWISAAAAVVSVALVAGGAGAPAGLVAATGSLVLAHRGLRPVLVRRRSHRLVLAHRGMRPHPHGDPMAGAPAPPRHDLPARMALTAVLVLSLSAAAAALGPLVGGVLTALPVLASMLAVFTHRQRGAPAATALLRGAVAGMAGFVAFVEVVALLIVPAGIAPAFALATIVALVVQVNTARPQGVSFARAAAEARA